MRNTHWGGHSFTHQEELENIKKSREVSLMAIA